MPKALFDPALLQALGQTPDEVRASLKRELGALTDELRKRQDDWATVQAGRDWSPAQDAEHIIKVSDAGGQAARLLLSDKEIRPFPQVPATLKDGKRQAPDFTLPSAGGLTWEELDTKWAEHGQRLTELADQIRETPGRTLWHPYFGELDALDWLRASIGHLRGHRELLQKSAAVRSEGAAG